MKNNVHFLEINKCKIAVYPIAEVRTVEIDVSIRAGSGYEEGEKWGAMHLLEHAMMLGTKDFPSMEKLEDYKEKYGISDEGWVSGTQMTFTFRFPGNYLKQGLRYMNQVIFSPALDESSLEKEKMVVEQEYKDKWDNPYKIFDMKIWEMLFSKGHPYTRDGLGQMDCVKGLTMDDLRKLHLQYFQPQNMVISVVGKVETEAVVSSLKKILEPRKNIFLADKYFKKIVPGEHRLLMEDTRVNRSSICFYWILDEEEIKDMQTRIGVYTFNYMFGVGSRSRLFQAVRNKQGLAYNFASKCWGWRNLRIMEIWAVVDREREQEFEELVKRELNEFLEKGVSRKEYLRANRYLDIRTLMAYDSGGRIADELIDGLFWEDKPIMPEDKNRMAKKVKQEELWELMRRNLSWEKVYKAVLRGK